jgi:hypothetical protein
MYDSYNFKKVSWNQALRILDGNYQAIMSLKVVRYVWNRRFSNTAIKLWTGWDIRRLHYNK